MAVARRRRHFGYVRRLPSGRYQASYIGANGERLQAEDTFATADNASAWLAAVQTELRRGAMPLASPHTVEEVAELWLAATSLHKRKATVDRDRTILDRHVLPALGHMLMHELEPAHVRRLVQDWQARFAPSTVVRHYAVTTAIAAFALDEGLIVRSPCRGVRLPALDPEPRRLPTDEELDLLRKVIDDGSRILVELGVLLGLRFGEAAAIQVSDVDLEREVLTIRRQRTREPAKSDGAFAPPKTRAGRRTLALPSQMATLLRGYIQESGLSGEQLLVRAPGGGPLVYSNWRQRIWLPATRQAALEGLHFHDLRRLNATALVSSGVDVKTTQRRLGHADPRLTLRLYAQAEEPPDRAAAELLGKRFLAPLSRANRATNTRRR